MSERNNQFSFGEFTWWTGVVEDVEDPLQAGRVKVRIYGYHSSDKNAVSTEALPWAMIATSTMSASTGGIGIMPHMIIKGSHVGGFFVDGKSAQLPLVLFTYPGMNGSAPDVDKLSRGTPMQKSLDSAGTWSEKASGAAPKYPHNKVIKTPSGHVIEVDDTPGKERLHIYHKSGSFYEFHTDGTIVSTAKGEQYQIVQKGLFIHVKGDAKINVDGNVIETIKGNKTSNISGNYTITCNSYSIKTKGSWSNNVGSSGLIKCGGSLTEKAGVIYLN